MALERLSNLVGRVPVGSDREANYFAQNFVAFDYLDITEHPKIFAKNAQLQFANNPVLHGIEEIQQSFVSAFSALSYMKHVPVTFGRLCLLPSRLLKNWISCLNADKVDNKVWFTVEISYKAKGDPKKPNDHDPGICARSPRYGGRGGWKAGSVPGFPRQQARLGED